MKTMLPAWAYALAMALAVMLGIPSAAFAGGHAANGCYSHRALTICQHNDGWYKSTLKRTYGVHKHKKKRWGHHRARHHHAHWRKHHHYRHHARHHQRHAMHHTGHVDLVTRQQSLAVGPCVTSLPKLPHSDECVHGAIIYPPVVERVTPPVPNSEPGRTRRYFHRGYYDPNAWRYRPTDRQQIDAVHANKGENH